MTHANAVTNKIVIRSAHRIEGQTILETDCEDYDVYKSLPSVIEYHGSEYVKTGWSSDRNYACYKPSTYTATAVSKKGSHHG